MDLSETKPVEIGSSCFAAVGGRFEDRCGGLILDGRLACLYPLHFTFDA